MNTDTVSLIKQYKIYSRGTACLSFANQTVPDEALF